MVRQCFSSGYCFVVPNEDESELVTGFPDAEYLKLGSDRVPAVGDIRYYDKFDRYGKRIAEHHFLIERVVSVDAERTNKIFTGGPVTEGTEEYSNSYEKLEVFVRVIYQCSLFVEKHPAIWEPPSPIADI